MNVYLVSLLELTNEFLVALVGNAAFFLRHVKDNLTVI